jgi:hypothetical protein
MTSGQVKTTGQATGTLAQGKVDWYNIAVLLLSTIVVSVIISTYVLCLAWLNLKNNDSDPLERAARLAAQDLLDINVVSANFGNVGIADFENSELGPGGLSAGAAGEVRSYNTVASLLRTALFLAKNYHLQALGEQAAGDLVELQNIKDELRRKIVASVQADGTGTIYEHIKRTLSSHVRGGASLQALTVKLGTSHDRMQITTIPAEAEDAPAFSGSGKLRTLTPLTVPLSKQIIYLHQQAREIAIVAPSQFVPDQKQALPTTLLIEAQFAAPSRQHDTSGQLITRKQVCVIAGADYKNQPLVNPPQDGCLALDFPQGRPDRFDSLLSILQFKDWQGRGEWLQALQGAVPGTGHLSPPAVTPLRSMNGSESLSIALYHWLRGQSRPISPTRLVAMLNQRWQIPSAAITADIPSAPAERMDRSEAATERMDGNDRAPEDLDQQVNSGLLKESGARLFALLYQNKPAEAGQKALYNCFQATANKFPPSTLPIVVDRSGAPNLPGQKGFDRKLVIDLLSGIYNTNLAAQETLATAQLMQSSSMRAYRASKERLFLAQTELDSLTSRLKNETKEDARKALSNEIDWRNNRITYEINEQKKQLRAYSLSQSAASNAAAVAGQSFECGSKLFQLTRVGINRLQQLKPINTALAPHAAAAFILGKRFIFMPLTESLRESDILDDAARAFEATAKSAGSASTASSPWLSKNLKIFAQVKNITDQADTTLLVEGRSLSDLKAETATSLKATAVVVVFTPDLIQQHPLGRAAKEEESKEEAQSEPLYFKEYPFKGLSVAERQLLYYCQNGYQSASLPSGKVVWSILARDLVASKGLNNNHQRLGLPLAPTYTGWYKRALNWSDSAGEKEALSAVSAQNSQARQTGGGLAAEWQLRSPVMLLDESDSGILKGATLSDPESGQRVPQIPPVGPDLM